MRKQLIILICIPVFFAMIILSAYVGNFIPINFDKIFGDEAVITVYIAELETLHRPGDDFTYDGIRYVYTGNMKAMLIVPVKGENSFLVIRGYEKEVRLD